MQKQPKAKNRKRGWIVFGIAGFIFFFFLLLTVKMVHSMFQPDKQCLTAHTTTSTPPTTFETAKDFFDLGNYNYDRGDCTQAVVAYSKAINLDPKFAEAYNNRAYTYMRMNNYRAALPDLDQAIKLKPTYVYALMNRGDIYNFYNIDRQKAIADYDKVITLVPPEKYQSLSVCGHRLIAMRGGMSPMVMFEIITKGYDVGCK